MTPVSLRGSCPGSQTSIIADDPVPAVLPVMRIFQPRCSYSDLAGMDGSLAEVVALDWRASRWESLATPRRRP